MTVLDLSMARKAGLLVDAGDHERKLQAFTDLVSAAIQEAVAAEREACAKLMESLRAKSRNHLFRSALTVAEGEIRSRSTT